MRLEEPTREQLEKHVRRFGREGVRLEPRGDVVELRAEGLSVPEIARTLGVSERTVKLRLAA